MKSRIHPEWRGDGTAKLRELERVKRVREQQLRAAQKKLKELEKQKTMQTEQQSTTKAKKVRTFTRKYLTPSDLAKIEALVAAHGEKAAEVWLSRTPRGILAKSPIGWGRGVLKDIRNGELSHKSAILGVAAEFIDRFGKLEQTESPQASPVSVDVLEQKVSTVAIEKPAAAQSFAMDVATITQIVMTVLESRGQGQAAQAQPVRPALPAASYSALPKPKVLVRGVSERSAFKELITREVRKRRISDPSMSEPDTYRAVHREAYEQYRLRTGFSVKTGNDESTLQHIVDDGHMSELYSVTYDMFNEPQRLLQVVSK